MTDSADAAESSEDSGRDDARTATRRRYKHPVYERPRARGTPPGPKRRPNRAGTERTAERVAHSPEWPFGPTEEERERPEPEGEEPPQLGLHALPDVDIAEHPTKLHVWCDLPGCDEGTIELSGDEWTLYVSAERSEEHWEEGDIHQRERGRFAERSIELPARCDIDEAEATYDDGVLLVRVPKHESEHTQTIGLD